jgi:hypothetical protein
VIPAPRSGDEGQTRARRIVGERAHGRCELCGQTGTDWAHRRSRAQGGPWRASNGLLQCRTCHAWCESHGGLADAGGWRLVHRDDDPAAVPVWLLGGPYPRGWHLLDDDGLLTWVDHLDAELPERPELPPWVLPGRVPRRASTPLLARMRASTERDSARPGP